MENQDAGTVYEKLIQTVSSDRKDLYERFPQDYGRMKKFDVMQDLNASKKPLIELAGPTSEYRLVDLKKLNRRLIISNIVPPSPDNIDLQADAFKLPFAGGSTSGIFFSAFPVTLDTEDSHFLFTPGEVFQESKRVLDKDGFLIVQGITDSDLVLLEKMGFKIREWLKRPLVPKEYFVQVARLPNAQFDSELLMRQTGIYFWDVIAQKNAT